MHISPDSIVLWRVGPVALNATIFCTWLVMGLLLLISWLVTRRLRVEPPLSRWQNFLEALVSYMRDQVAEITQQEPARYLPFLGTLFLFISLANLLAPVPRYAPPTASLSTAAALLGGGSVERLIRSGGKGGGRFRRGGGSRGGRCGFVAAQSGSDQTAVISLQLLGEGFDFKDFRFGQVDPMRA